MRSRDNIASVISMYFINRHFGDLSTMKRINHIDYITEEDFNFLIDEMANLVIIDFEKFNQTFDIEKYYGMRPTTKIRQILQNLFSSERALVESTNIKCLTFEELVDIIYKNRK